MPDLEDEFVFGVGSSAQITETGMTGQDLFGAGDEGIVPQGDAARQAVDSLRGYAYQITAAALAWLDLDDRARLFLEVAEDYAVVAAEAIRAVQVKDTSGSGSITLNTESVREAIASFVSLVDLHPDVDVQLRYFTTSQIGVEKAVADRPAGVAGLTYWREAALAADVNPLRSILESNKFPKSVQDFVKARDDAALRRDMLRKIHWDCGKPDIDVLRKEFDERLVLVGRNVFNLPAPETARIADSLIYQVLETSISSQTTDRVLTRGSLYTAIDRATRISLPRATVELLNLLSSGMVTSALSGFNESLGVVVTDPGWLLRGEALPAASRVISRKIIEAQVLDRMHRFGAAVIYGASGLGKSSLARLVAEGLGSGFVTIDFRDADAKETCSRLDAVLSRIGGLRQTTFIFDDLNSFNDPLVVQSLARAMSALRRRDKAIVFTCYLAPSARSLGSVGLDLGCLFGCPYFSEDEAAALVDLHGGDAKLWGRIAYVAGAFGHPQLVYAFISGMHARGWPKGELTEIVGNGLSSGDIEAEREISRRTLISALPNGARNLLYRLSLTVGRFDRDMAFAIAKVQPAISTVGESMDALIGPWLEIIEPGSYRVSPLAVHSGQDMIAPGERSAIHSAIAAQFMAKGSVDASDADAIIMHALVGKNEQVLVALATSIVTSDERTRDFLAVNLSAFKLMRTDRPIYPDNPSVAALLRLAQFKILVTARAEGRIGKCASALFCEAMQQPNEELRVMFRGLAFGTVLGTMGIANHLDNWLDLLEEFRAMAGASELLSDLQQNFERRDARSVDMFGALFAIGSAGPVTVARLESLIDQLDRLEPAQRKKYLSLINLEAPDYSVFINSAWTSDRPKDAASAINAAERYRRMAMTTAPWATKSLTAQCWIARAVMLDEYGDDRRGALQVLDEAVAELGEDVLLARARAKIYWRAHDHSQALEILRAIADKVGLNNPIERSFALREAAISAAKSGDWRLAETWFLDSEASASQSQLSDMAAMAVGLTADGAIAAIKAGRVERGLSGLLEALKALAKIDPSVSLRAYYCHCVVRHVVLWVYSHIDKRNINVGDEPIVADPGCCSNPEPPEAIRTHPIGAIDFAFYMLAESELASGKNVGIADHLQDHLIDGPIPGMEIGLRVRRIDQDIRDLNAEDFTSHLWAYVEAIAYLSQKGAQLRSAFDVLKPGRGNIPAIARDRQSFEALSRIVKDALLTYIITAACSRSLESITVLRSAIDREFGPGFPGATLLSRTINSTQSAAASFDEALVDVVRNFEAGIHQDPRSYCVAAVRFFQQARQSKFKRHLIPLIAGMLRTEWTRIVVSETFRLSMPSHTVPAIKTVLSKHVDDEQFVSTLLLAIIPATGVLVPQHILEELIAAGAA